MIILSNENLKAVNGVNIEQKDKSKIRQCMYTALEQDSPMYPTAKILLTRPQLKIANWLQREAAKKAKTIKIKSIASNGRCTPTC